MKSTVEAVGPTRVKLAVEVPFEELQPTLDAAYKRIAAQVRVPGFRPGKVPARIIDQRVGRQAVIEEALQEALPRVYGEAVRDSGVRALGQPTITDQQVDDGTSLRFTAEVDVRPELTLPDLSTLAVTVGSVTVEDAEVDEQVDELRDRFATLRGVERAVQTGDFVSLDLRAVVDGEEVEGGSATGLSHEVGGDTLIDGLDEAITGLTAGQSATFASQLRAGDHAGSDAEITATVNSVKERERPAADDEFAQLASEFDTMAELRADVRTRVERAKAMAQGGEARDKVLEALIEAVDVPLPESVVEQTVADEEHRVVHQLNHDEDLLARYLETQGTTREQFTAELRTTAERSVRAQLILDQIAEEQQVQIGDGELTEYLIRQAQRYDMSPQDFANEVVQNGNLPALMSDLRRNKALAVVLEAVTVTDDAGNTVDLQALSPAALADEAYEDDADLGDDTHDIDDDDVDAEDGVDDPDAR